MLTKDYLVEQATLYESKQEWQNAIQAYIQALSRDLNNADLRNSLGMAYEKNEQLAEAEASYRRAIELSPTLAVAHYHLAHLYFRQGKREEAARTFAYAAGRISNRKDREYLFQQMEQVLGERVEVCHQCQCVSPFLAAFKRRGKQVLCPHCFSVGVPRIDANLIVTLVGLVLPFVALTICTPFGSRGYLLFSMMLFIYYFVGVIFIYLHEIAHVVTAWLLGGTVFNFTIGQGPTLFKKKWRDTEIELHLLPTFGFVEVGFPTPRGIRLRALLFIAVPLIMHLAIALAVLASVDNIILAILQLNGLFVVNSLFFIANIFPFRNSVVGKRVVFGTDGAQVLQLLIDKTFSKQFVTTYYMVQANRAVDAKNLDEAYLWVLKGLSHNPTDNLLLARKGMILSRQERFGEAEQAFQALLSASASPNVSITQHNTAMAWNNIAFAQTLADNSIDAYTYAQKAFWVLPWNPYVLGTLGTIFVEKGEYEKGVGYLEDSITRHEGPASKATNKALAALGYWHLGDAERASTYLSQAKEEGAEGYVLSFVAQRMAPAQSAITVA